MTVIKHMRKMHCIMTLNTFLLADKAAIEQRQARSGHHDTRAEEVSTQACRPSRAWAPCLWQPPGC